MRSFVEMCCVLPCSTCTARRQIVRPPCRVDAAVFVRLASLERVVLAFVGGTLVWMAIIVVWRFALKLLLCWHGWMYEEHGKVSLSTKVWMVSGSVYYLDRVAS